MLISVTYEDIERIKEESQNILNEKILKFMAMGYETNDFMKSNIDMNAESEDRRNLEYFKYIAAIQGERGSNLFGVGGDIDGDLYSAIVNFDETIVNIDKYFYVNSMFKVKVDTGEDLSIWFIFNFGISEESNNYEANLLGITFEMNELQTQVKEEIEFHLDLGYRLDNITLLLHSNQSDSYIFDKGIYFEITIDDLQIHHYECMANKCLVTQKGIITE